LERLSVWPLSALPNWMRPPPSLASVPRFWISPKDQWRLALVAELETLVEQHLGAVDALLVFEPGGATGHPDHRAAAVAGAAVEAAADPPGRQGAGQDSPRRLGDAMIGFPDAARRGRHAVPAAHDGRRLLHTPRGTVAV
jgi:hypothetical protein